MQKQSLSFFAFIFVGVAVVTADALFVFHNNAKAQTTNTTISAKIPLCEIARDLTIGSEGKDIRCLQKYLNWAGFRITTYGPGSPGNESTYFGPLTQNVLINWQNANATHVLTPLGIYSGTKYWDASSFDRYVHLVRVSKPQGAFLDLS